MAVPGRLSSFQVHARTQQLSEHIRTHNRIHIDVVIDRKSSLWASQQPLVWRVFRDPGIGTHDLQTRKAPSRQLLHRIISPYRYSGTLERVYFAQYLFVYLAW